MKIPKLNPLPKEFFPKYHVRSEGCIFSMFVTKEAEPCPARPACPVGPEDRTGVKLFTPWNPEGLFHWGEASFMETI
jgi:hypothetical protein